MIGIDLMSGRAILLDRKDIEVELTPWADNRFVNITGDLMTGGLSNLTSINPLTTLAESWIGPSSTTGIYFKGGNVGIGTTNPTGKLDVQGLSTGHLSANLTAGDLVVDTTSKTVNIGRLSDVSGDNTNFVFRDRLGNVKSYWENAGSGSISFGNFNTNYGISIANSALGANATTQARLVVNSGSASFPSAIFSSGNVGIGTTSPESKLTVSLTGQAVNTDFLSGTMPLGLLSGSGRNIISGIAMSSNEPTDRGILQFRKSRGTVISPTAVVNGDTLASFSSGGYGGSSTIFSSQIDFIVDGTVSTNEVPQRISFLTGTTSANRRERLTIKSDGNVGIGTTSPSQALDVNGKIAINGQQTIYNADAINSNYAGTLYIGNGGGSLTSGAYYNMVMGKEALYSNTSGSLNVAIGVGAMYTNTTGEQNFALGFHSLYDNSTGEQNLGIGTYALVANTIGNYNVAIGNVSLFYNTTGSGNVSLGYDSGSFNKDWGTLTTNNYSVFIGYDSKAYADGDTNEIVIGYNADGKGSNTVVIGNSSITNTYLGGYINPVTGYKSTDGSIGATGSFTTADSKTITVKDGLITNIA